MIHNQDELIVFRTLIKYLQFLSIFPQHGGSFNLKLVMGFFIPLTIIGSPAFMGVFGHLYQSYLNKKFDDAVHGVYAINFCIMYYSVVSLFYTRGNEVLHFFRYLSKVNNEYQTKYKKAIEAIDNFTKIIIYCDFIIAIWFSLESYRKSLFCDNGKYMKDPHYVCGSIIPLWYPLEINKNMKPLIATYITVFVAGHIPILASAISFYYVCSLLEVRIEHVKSLLKKIDFDVKEDNKTKSELLQCVEHYTEIIRMVREMNDTFGFIFAPSHNAYNNFMLGICGYLIIKESSFTYGFQLIMWILVQWVACHCGQILVDANLRLREELYNIPWYNMNPSLRSTFKNFQGQVSLPLYLKIEPVHIMNLFHFTEIMKGAYTFLMFLLRI